MRNNYVINGEEFEIGVPTHEMRSAVLQLFKDNVPNLSENQRIWRKWLDVRHKNQGELKLGLWHKDKLIAVLGVMSLKLTGVSETQYKIVTFVLDKDYHSKNHIHEMQLFLEFCKLLGNKSCKIFMNINKNRTRDIAVAEALCLFKPSSSFKKHKYHLFGDSEVMTDSLQAKVDTDLATVQVNAGQKRVEQLEDENRQAVKAIIALQGQVQQLEDEEQKETEARIAAENEPFAVAEVMFVIKPVAITPMYKKALYGAALFCSGAAVGTLTTAAVLRAQYKA
jgi:hypothetical protein